MIDQDFIDDLFAILDEEVSKEQHNSSLVYATSKYIIDQNYKKFISFRNLLKDWGFKELIPPYLEQLEIKQNMSIKRIERKIRIYPEYKKYSNEKLHFLMTNSIPYRYYFSVNDDIFIYKTINMPSEVYSIFILRNEIEQDINHVSSYFNRSIHHLSSDEILESQDIPYSIKKFIMYNAEYKNMSEDERYK